MKPMPKRKKRLLDAEDICRIRVIIDAAFSPDGRKVAYALQTISEDRRKYFSHVYMLDVNTRRSTQFTFGEVHDHGLAWSPNGSFLAFLSTRNKKSGIYIIPAQGGAERKLLEKDGSFSDLRWTPDEQALVYAFRFNDSHTIQDEKKKAEPPVFRHITRLFYRLDDVGFLPRDRYHIWKIEIEGGKDTQLTLGPYDDVSPAVSPDGRWIVFVSNHSKNPDLDDLRHDLFLMPINGGKARRIPAPAGPKLAPVFSPDGRLLAYLGHTNPNDAWGVTNLHVWTVGLSGRPAARDLMPTYERTAEDQTLGDMGEESIVAPAWSQDGKRIFFLASDTGSTQKLTVPARGGSPSRVTTRDWHVKHFGLSGKTSAAVISDLTNPTDLFLMPAAVGGGKHARKVTAVNSQLLTEINMPTTKSIRFKGRDGFDLQGWLVYPVGFNREKKYPAILEIHGGPRAQYGFTFFHEMLLLASNGYLVFYTNPRGGGGRGEAFAGSIIGKWGSVDYEDCMAAADYLERLPYVDQNRLGVTGGSYGGFMTNWIVGHTDRFRAAVTQRSVVNLHSFFGSSDFGYSLHREFLGYPWTRPDIYRKCSPLSYAQRIRTPLLILHSEQDLRCGIEQAEQLFATLKMMKKKVEFARFPEEPHGLSRHGRPDRRVARLQWILKWFKRYLQK